MARKIIAVALTTIPLVSCSGISLQDPAEGVRLDGKRAVVVWKGLRVEEENRCAPYNRKRDYKYPRSIERDIVASMRGEIYEPYTETFFNSLNETDIEHIVATSEAHDSGLCAASNRDKKRFASDLRNLTLASPDTNRNMKRGLDAGEWLPEKNKCWYAGKVVEIKKAYKLSVDQREMMSLKEILSKCASLKMNFPPARKLRPQPSYEGGHFVATDEPAVKKSRGGICHMKVSSSYYKRLKKFTSYATLASCLNSGGRCPKRDIKCENRRRGRGEAGVSGQKNL